jgi:hypothetical protein
MKKAFQDRLIAYINRKNWWHVPPQDPEAYSERGKFYASTYREAEFYGRPNDSPERVRIERPLVGDERAVSQVLGIPAQHAGMTLQEIAQHDARWRDAAIARGYDSILLMSQKDFSEFRASGRVPRSMELNILKPRISAGRSAPTKAKRPDSEGRARMAGAKREQRGA